MTLGERIAQFLNKPHDGRPILALSVAVCVVSAFTFWIWPTPYREWATRGGKHGNGPFVKHRVNRLTGAKEYGFSGIFGTINWHPESGSSASGR